MYALLKGFFFIIIISPKGQVCIYFVGLLMQVQNGKIRLKILKRLSGRVLLLLLLDFVCGCSRSHTRGSLYVMNNQPAGLGAACSSRVSQRLTDATLKKKEISKATWTSGGGYTTFCLLLFQSHRWINVSEASHAEQDISRQRAQPSLCTFSALSTKAAAFPAVAVAAWRTLWR